MASAFGGQRSIQLSYGCLCARILIVSSARNIGKMSAGWINRGGEHALVEQLVTQFKRIN